MPRRICIECHHKIALPTPRRTLCEKCRRAHAVAAHRRKTTSTTRGNSVNTVTAKAPPTGRLKQKTGVTFSDILHAPAEKAARMLDAILAGKMSVTG